MTTKADKLPASPAELRCWVEISGQALRHNATTLQKMIGPNVQIMAVVKADAYGHGIIPVARALLEAGVQFFGVTNVTEALRLKDELPLDASHIFLLSPVLPSERKRVVQHRFVPWISSTEEAVAFAQEAAAQSFSAERPFEVEVEMDTGMGRSGILPSQVNETFRAIAELPALRVRGILSHLSSSDEDDKVTQRQFTNFESLIAPVKRETIQIHIQNSGGILGNYITPSAVNFVRPGLALYGISPIGAKQKQLQPVATWKTRIGLIRELPAGQGISYGQTFITLKPMRTATLCVGYADGYRRHLSNRNADVLLHGTRCPILGRITMDLTVIDISHLPPERVQVGDEVVLMGRQGAEEITATELASKASTIAWEIFTGLTPRDGRYYVP